MARGLFCSHRIMLARGKMGVVDYKNSILRDVYAFFIQKVNNNFKGCMVL